MFVKHNENPKGKNTTDCVIRAISKATGKGWDNTYRELFELSFKEKKVFNDKSLFQKYLKNIGFEKCKTPKINDKRITVEEFYKYFYEGTYIVKISGHLATIIDGVLYDTWNCGEWKVGNYWKKK